MILSSDRNVKTWNIPKSYLNYFLTPSPTDAAMKKRNLRNTMKTYKDNTESALDALDVLLAIILQRRLKYSDIYRRNKDKVLLKIRSLHLLKTIIQRGKRRERERAK